jgi:hypothetical protein
MLNSRAAIAVYAPSPNRPAAIAVPKYFPRAAAAPPNVDALPGTPVLGVVDGVVGVDPLVVDGVPPPGRQPTADTAKTKPTAAAPANRTARL